MIQTDSVIHRNSKPGHPSLVHYVIQGVIASSLLLILVLSQNEYFVLIGIAGIILLIISAIPSVRILILIALLPFAHAGIGLDMLPGFGVYNIYALLVILLFVFSLPFKLPWSSETVPVLKFSVLMLLCFIPSLLATVDLTESIKAIINLTSNIIIAYAVFMTLAERKSSNFVQTALFVFILTALLSSMYGLYQTFTSVSIFALYVGRAYFFLFQDVNYYASFLVMAISLSFGFIFYSKTVVMKLFFIFASAILSISVIASVSRSALLTLFLVFLIYAVYLFVSQKGSRKILSVIFISSMVALILIFALTDIGGSMVDIFTLSRRLESAVTGHDASFEQRLNILSIGFEMGKNNPIIGVGIGAFEKSFPQYQGALLSTGYERSAHNTALRIFAETGIVGFVSSLLFILVLFKYLFYGIKYTMSQHERMQSVSILIAIGSFFLMSLWLDMLTEPHFWVLCGIGLANVYILKTKYSQKDSVLRE